MTNDLVTQLRTYGRQVEQHLAASPAESPATDRVLVEAAPPGPRRSTSGARAGALAAIVVVVVIVSVWFFGPRSEQRPADSPTGILPSTVSNGWVAFAAWDSQFDSDVYLVREGSAPRRVTGSDTDTTDEICPAFSPDGTRLVFGQASGNQSQPGGYRDGSLVITDLSADGERISTTTIALEGATFPPCAIWSPDGRWIAFGAGRQAQGTVYSDEVWLVDTETEEIRRLSGLAARDIEWAPDATELFIASNDIVAYSVATGETRRLGDVAGVGAIALSPDGQSIAFQRRRPGSQTGEDKDLWLMDADGTNQRILAADYKVLHGIGPVWSPDGDHIVYQRLCDRRPAPSRGICREQHEAVVVTVSDNDPLEAVGTQVVIPPPETTGTEGPIQWYPFSVTWSPDSSTLLYLAGGESRSTESLPTAVVAAPVNAETQPVVLSEDLNAAVYNGVPWLPFQSWSRVP